MQKALLVTARARNKSGGIFKIKGKDKDLKKKNIEKNTEIRKVQ